MAEQKQQEKKRRFRKPGRTLLIKPVELVEFDFKTLNLDQYTGLKSNILTKSGARFLVFDSIENSSTCLKALKNNSDILVKYAHYRLYFTINGLDNETDYNLVKQAHIDKITTCTDSSVLYYKLYKKNKESYLGCGDLTIDTKEGMDLLLQNQELKTFSLHDDKFTGEFYQYNKFRNNSEKYNDEDDDAPSPNLVKTKTKPQVSST